MPRTDFDRYADDYEDLVNASIGSSGFPAAFFAERKAQEIVRTLSSLGIRTEGMRLLNFGCGVGAGDPPLVRSLPGASIFSVDVSQRSIETARATNRNLPGLSYSEFDGHHIPFPGTFDVILIAGVLHHIPPSERPTVLSEVRDNLSPAGLLFVFEHNPWNPLTRNVVRDCPFDNDAKLLSSRALRRLLKTTGFCIYHTRYIHFFPRALVRLLPLERHLHAVPAGAQYYCVASRCRTQEHD